MRRCLTILAVLTLALSWTPTAFAQSSEGEAWKSEIESLKQSEAAIEKELEEIKALLKAAPGAPVPTAPAPPSEEVVNIEGAPFKGQSNATVTLVDFTDYQCPFCGRYFRDTYPELERDFIKTGKVKYVLRDLPLEVLHPLALKAAEATHCAGEQGKYWEMHDQLFTNQRELTRPDLSKHAQALGLNIAAFDQCLDIGKSTARIRKDLEEAQDLNVGGTPTFFVGLTDPSKPEVKGMRIEGALPYPVFKDAIERLLPPSK